MRNKMIAIGVLIAVAAFAQMAFADPMTNIVQNGTFQTTATFNPAGYATLNAGSTALPGWTIGGNSVDVVSSSFWQAAPSGGNSVDLSGDAPGLTSQPIPTDPGVLFTISFYLSVNPYATSPQYLQVTWGSETFTYTVNAGNSLSDMRWQLITINNLTVTGNPTYLSFASLSSGSTGPVIAGISVVDPPAPEVPEPASMMLLGSGLMGLAGLARWKRFSK